MILQARPGHVSAQLILSSVDLPATRSRPAALILTVGLPATGKSTFCRRLAPEIDAVILSSDDLRMRFFPKPTYSYAESGRLFRAIHAATRQLLLKDVNVIIDATNLSERDREPAQAVARLAQARLVVVYFTAPEPVIVQRLDRRQAGLDPLDRSRADLGVYELMRGRLQPPQGEHWTIDTTDTKTTEDALRRIVDFCRPATVGLKGGRD